MTIMTEHQWEISYRSKYHISHDAISPWMHHLCTVAFLTPSYLTKKNWGLEKMSDTLQTTIIFSWNKFYTWWFKCHGIIFPRVSIYNKLQLAQMKASYWTGNKNYRKVSNLRCTGYQTEMFLVSYCSCLYPARWSQVLSREWRCCYSSADRRCSNYIWVIKILLRCGLS